MNKFCVVGVGRAYTDIIARVPHSFLTTHNIPIDAGRDFDSATIRKIISCLPESTLMAGGASANTIATVADLGARAGFFAKVNDDAPGACFLEDFRRRNVHLCCDPHRHKAGMSSPVCIVLLTDDGHRSFATCIGCADEYDSDEFTSFDFGTTDFFLADAQLMMDSPADPVIRESILAAQGKCRVVINFHNISSWLSYAEMARFVAAHADILIGNEAEHEQFHRVVGAAHSPHQICVTTQGARGVEARVGTETIFVPGEKPKNFVSSVGAGDGFTAGLLFGLSNGLDTEASLKYGVKTAVAILEEVGARLTKSFVIA